MEVHMCYICGNRENIIGPTYCEKIFCTNSYCQQSIRDLDILDKNKDWIQEKLNKFNEKNL